MKTKEIEQRQNLYHLGWITGYKFALRELLKMKRPTKADMKEMLKNLSNR